MSEEPFSKASTDAINLAATNLQLPSSASSSQTKGPPVSQGPPAGESTSSLAMKP